MSSWAIVSVLGLTLLMTGCAHSQPPARTSLFVRAAGYLPDISGSCPPSRVSPSGYRPFNFEAVGALSAFSLWAPFRHLRNKMRPRPSMSPNTDAFGGTRR